MTPIKRCGGCKNYNPIGDNGTGTCFYGGELPSEKDPRWVTICQGRFYRPYGLLGARKLIQTYEHI